ncbi:putative white collar 1 protein [Diaporthe ampelina]|uniref:Putative white collar 1 protein n=1 Tax=Diaporthe ampelina TaxID=1214573 RepID=A0A0G2FLJ5_9PEZI|nr:putative white collar 1 protein [Diaporthe ampelina]
MNEFYQNQLAQAAAAQQRRQHPGRPANMMMPPSVNTGRHGNGGSPTMQQPLMHTMSPDTPMMGCGDSLDEIISQNTATRRRRNGLPSYGNMGNMTSPITMPSHTGNFEFSAMSADVMNNMMGFSNLSMGQMQPDPNGMGLYGNPNMSPQFANTGIEPVSPDFAMDMNQENPLGVASANVPGSALADDGDDELMVGNPRFGSTGSCTPQAAPGSGGAMAGYNMAPALSREVSNANSFNQSPVSPNLSTARGSVVPETPVPAQAESGSATPGNADVKSESKNIYSKSGFDLVRALYYIATRPNPEIQLGAVDLSCAFVVCDVTMNDCPIIYISDNFQNLTGYSRHDIMGQNCRFLQAPDGKVEAGTKREFVANDAVLNLKQKIQEGKEVQQSLINYRKGGKPFLNLLTMIPIPWDTKEIRYFIGFQIDLVECPDAIAGQELGKVAVNYKHSDIGQYIWNPPEGDRVEPDAGQTLSADDVSTLLQQLKPGGTNLGDWHKQSWDKMLLENADDVVHVLSLKGLFMYLSPSCKRVLEYDTKELIGNQLSSICHPSDIVPVTRELKDTAVGNHVNIVFRIRRKESGYTWFESHGSLFVEQGKGKKCIILVGRKRPVFALSRSNIENNGGIGDGELWSKLSTSGIDDNIFDELKTTRCSSWQYELRQMEKVNRLLAEELGQLLSNKKKRKRRKGVGNVLWSAIRQADRQSLTSQLVPRWQRRFTLQKIKLAKAIISLTSRGL